MSEVIGLFSSDEAQLYKTDIFRALALPEKYVLHFRYLAHHIHDDFSNHLNHIVGKEAVIFFAIGNNPNIPPDRRQIKTVSIRKVKINKIYKAEDTELFHFYLQLKEFVDLKIKPENGKEKIPPYKFVSRLNVDNGYNHAWIKRIEEVRNEFEDCLFFNIQSIKKNKKVIIPLFSEAEYESYYKLKDESEYTINFSFSDAILGNSTFKMQEKSHCLSVNMPEDLHIGARADNRSFTIITHTLERDKSLTFIKFYSCVGNTVNDVFLRFNIERRKTKIVLLGVFSALGVWIYIAIQLTVEWIKNPSIALNICKGLWILLILTILSGLVPGLLYKFFNKK